MDFEFDEDQIALRETAADVLAKECPPSYVRRVIEQKDDGSTLWTTLTRLDWPGLAIEEAAGGSGATAIELAIVLEQLGYVADPSPFMATTSQYAAVISECGDPDQRRQLLGAVCNGDVGAAGFAEGAVTASRAGQGWQLSGEQQAVLDADRAAMVAVVASTPDGPSAFAVPATDLQVIRTPSLDATLHVTTVTLDGVYVPRDRHLEIGGGAALQRARELALMAWAATMVGACERALDLVVAYASEREQFDVRIGSFQAVKHKAVDMYVAIERARALAYFAAATIAEQDSRRAVAASMAKAAAGDAQRLVFRHSIQLFGGIGFTWENDLHLYLRRAKAGELLLGGTSEHRAAVARALLGSGRPTEVLNG